MKVHGRIALFALALLVAALLPASGALASSATQHHLVTYKVEKHLTLPEGESRVVTVSCETNDIATDGMWRVDDVDQYNPQVDPFDDPWDLSSIEITQSQSTAIDTYTFRVFNPTGGDSQLKFWVVCLGRKTAPDTEQHEWTTTAKGFVYDHPEHFAAAPGNFTDPDGAFTAGALNDDVWKCGADEIFIAPSWRVDGSYAENFMSRPGPVVFDPTKFSTWLWGFWIDPSHPPTSITVGGRCLSIYSSVVNSHKHRLYSRWKTSEDPSAPFNKGKQGWEHQISCGELEKGLVGGYRAWQPGFKWNSHVLHWLGMDPRPKSRDYRVLGGSGGDYYLNCFHIRTGNKIPV